MADDDPTKKSRTKTLIFAIIGTVIVGLGVYYVLAPSESVRHTTVQPPVPSKQAEKQKPQPKQPAKPAPAPRTPGLLSLSLPVACEPGKTCWVSNYVDHDPGEGKKDYMCGTATYNVKNKNGLHHQGTDFAIQDLAAMKSGVDVLAAAPGIITGVRDSMKDISAREIDAESLKGKFCGNGVAIKHENGFTSQYCHLRRGSIAVNKGTRVSRGQKLGLIGLSGFTEYPHLHITIRRNGNIIDPFVGLSRKQGCGPGKEPLWQSDVLAKLPYGPSALYSAGFAGAKPNSKKARAGAYRKTTLNRTAFALVLWVDMFQIRKGDELRMVIIGPDGKTFHKHKLRFKKNRARAFRFSGKKRKTPTWPTGPYAGVIQLKRTDQNEPGQKVYTVKRTMMVK
ncbi:MAG: peptidoglycan DD-metalloendopeptidase family protein [Rhodospirillaceae bacterium]|jgi:murein DD-endopeptidase MepM/ murein hydrolase activator NlpD